MKLQIVLLLSIFVIIYIQFSSAENENLNTRRKSKGKKLHKPSYASTRKSRQKRDILDDWYDGENSEERNRRSDGENSEERNRRSGKPRKPNAGPSNIQDHDHPIITSRASTGDRPTNGPFLIRLRGGPSENEGRVEVKRTEADATWGVICDDWFDIKDANVICKQLGYRRATAFHAGGNSHYGDGKGNMVLDDIRCAGTEAGLHQCRSAGWGTHNCDRDSQVAGVTCEVRVPVVAAAKYSTADQTFNKSLSVVNSHPPNRKRIMVRIPHSSMPQWMLELLHILLDGPEISEPSPRPRPRPRPTPVPRPEVPEPVSRPERPRPGRPGYNLDRPGYNYNRPGSAPMPDQPDPVPVITISNGNATDDHHGNTPDSLECYTDPKGIDYRGVKSMTDRGKTCQRWTTNSPHIPSYTIQDFPDHLGDHHDHLGGHNYCRNMGDAEKAWCYTTDPSIRWDFCDIGAPQEECQEQVIAPARTSMNRFAKFSGAAIPQNDLRYHDNVIPDRCAELCVAETGFVCRSFDFKRTTNQCWLSDKTTNDVPALIGGPADVFDFFERIDIGPVSHYLLRPNAAIPGHNIMELRNTALETCAHMCNIATFGCASFDFARSTNQCWLSDTRAADASLGTEFAGNPYDYYERQGDATPDCYTGNGHSYRGEVSFTKSGERCFNWSDLEGTGLPVGVTVAGYPNTGLGNHNFCRNPDEDQKPWCYYGNSTRPLVGWTYCAINQCETPAPPPVAPRTEAPPPPPAPVTTRQPNLIGTGVSIATNKPAFQSSIGQERSLRGPAGNAVDGNVSPIYSDRSCTLTTPVSQPWWYVDLGREYEITSVKVVNRNANSNRLKRTDIRIGNDVSQIRKAGRCARISSAMVTQAFQRSGPNKHVITANCDTPLRGRYVHIQRMADAGTNVQLTLCEVLVFGTETNAPPPPPTLAPTTAPVIPVCTAAQFLCTDNSKCISDTHTCDLTPDCPDNSDEVGCPNPLDDFRTFQNSALPANLAEPDATYIDKSVPECAQHCITEMAFVCRSIDYIHATETCKLYSETRAGTGGLETRVQGTTHYERISQSANCAAADGKVYHPCTSGRCISLDWLCDGDNDCGDYGDEANCGYDQYNIRLVDDDDSSNRNPQQGRVEVFYLGKWGTVCDDKWSLEDANVVCRELNYTRGAITATGNAQFGTGTDLEILLDNVECTGNEASLRACTHAGWGVNNCLPKEAAGVLCEPNEGHTCPTGKFQCVRDGLCIPANKNCDGTSDCYDDSDEADCNSCRSTQFQCKNNRCIDLSWKCDAEDDCGDKSDEQNCPITLKLVGGRNENEGRVAAYFAHEWGTICDDGFNNVAATVVCKELGLGDSGQALRAPGGTGPIWLDDIVCDGNEAELSACQHSPISVNNCDHSEDVGVRCTTTTTGGGGGAGGGNQPPPQSPQPQVTPAPVECGVKRAANSIVNTRVVGGGSAKPGSWPWQVQLILKGAGHYCGGTLIDNQYVLSAAHCFQRYGKNSFSVRLGEHNIRRSEGREQTFDIECLHLHENYDNGNTNNDIALIKLDGRVNFDLFTQPACLTSTSEFNTGKRCWISGWGNTGNGNYPDLLQEGEVPILSRGTCTDYRVYGNKLTNNMMCAGYLTGGIDSCDGDSGGPLVCQNSDGVWKLVGITSWGYGCAEANAPGVYTRVERYLSWINQKRTTDSCP